MSKQEFKENYLFMVKKIDKFKLKNKFNKVAFNLGSGITIIASTHSFGVLMNIPTITNVIVPIMVAVNLLSRGTLPGAVSKCAVSAAYSASKTITNPK